MAEEHVAGRDKLTAAQWQGMTAKQASALRATLSQRRAQANEDLKQLLPFYDPLVKFIMTGDAQGKRNFESLQVSPVNIQDAEKLDWWLREFERRQLVVYALDLADTMLVFGASLTSAEHSVLEAAKFVRRVTLIRRLVNEVTTTQSTIRRFTEDEQNSFMHGR